MQRRQLLAYSTLVLATALVRAGRTARYHRRATPVKWIAPFYSPIRKQSTTMNVIGADES